jgi:transcriptional regulator with PAS, ATPase and Fis domain
VKGAFTGANSNRTGLIVEANMGTLFMDEVNNLPTPMQSKLLRVLQEGEVRPVGSNRKIRVNVRIISASSLSLSKQVEKGNFREDLYFRLMVYPIYIPTLNERKRDVPVLADHFLNRFAKEQNKSIEFLHEDILEYLNFKNWAGNIRELENFMERLVTLSPNNNKILDISLLPQNFAKEFDKFFKMKTISKVSSLKDSLNEYEKNLVLKALEENDWNQNKTARSLDLLEQTLRAKMKKLGIVKR